MQRDGVHADVRELRTQLAEEKKHDLYSSYKIAKYHQIFADAHRFTTMRLCVSLLIFFAVLYFFPHVWLLFMSGCFVGSSVGKRAASAKVLRAFENARIHIGTETTTPMLTELF